MIFTACLLRHAFLKANKLKYHTREENSFLTPQYDGQNEETYCVISLYIVYLCQALLVVSLSQYAFTATLIFLGSTESNLFWRILVYGYRNFIYVSSVLVRQIVFLQYLEWYAMRFVILFEKKLTLFQLNYIQQNTMQYKNKEANKIKVIATLYILASLTTILLSMIQYVVGSIPDWKGQMKDTYTFEYGSFFS